MNKFTLKYVLAIGIALLGIGHSIQAQNFMFVQGKEMKFSRLAVDSFYTLKLQIANLSGQDLKLDWQIASNGLDTANFEYQICDNHNCYSGNALPVTSPAAFAILRAMTNDTGYFLMTVSAKKVTPAEQKLKIAVFNHDNTSDRDTATFIFPKSFTGIAGSSKGNISMELFPVPVTDMLNILVDNGRTGQIEIYDLTGHKVISAPVKSNSTQLSIKGLSSGMYTLYYRDAAGNFGVRKFVKE